MSKKDRLRVGDRVTVINDVAYSGTHGTVVKRIKKGDNFPHKYYRVQLDADNYHSKPYVRYIRAKNCVKIIPFMTWSGKHNG